MNPQTEQSLIECLTFAKALLNVMSEVLSSNMAMPGTYVGYKEYIRKYNQLAKEVINLTEKPKFIDLYDITQIPSFGDTLEIEQKRYFESVYSNLSFG